MVFFIGFAQEKILHPVKESSSVKFSIRNFGLNVAGSFQGLAGEIIFDPEKPSESKFDVSVEAATISTGNNARDKHLRSDDYFDVAHFPRIRITGEKPASAKGEATYILMANLELHGIKGKQNIPFTVRKYEGGWLFEASFTVNRRDYKVGGNSISMADNATVNLKILGK